MISNRGIKHFGVLLLALVAVIAIDNTSYSADDQLVPDPKLRRDIADELGVESDQLTIDDLLELKSLTAIKVGRLQGLEYAENLEELTLKDLDPFAEMDIIYTLSELKVLRITRSNFHRADLQGIGNLVELEVLDLSNNALHVFPAIEGLVSLEELNLHNNRIEKLAGIGFLRNLLTLDLSRNSLSRLDELAELENILHVDLSYNKISNISPLLDNQGLGKGDSLRLQYNLLDLSVSSKVLDVIRKLNLRGVRLTYFPQCTTSSCLDNL